MTDNNQVYRFKLNDDIRNYVDIDDYELSDDNRNDDDIDGDKVNNDQSEC